MTTLGPLTAETKFRLLLQISQKISGTLDLDEILSHILDTVRTVVHYDAAGIFILTRADPYARRRPSHQTIAGMVSRGFEPRPLESDPMLLSGKGIIGHVIRTGQCVVAPDVRTNAHYVEGRAPTLSEIAVPIVTEGRPIGALNLESDVLAEYTDADVETLRFFAEAVAISIEKALLHRQVLEKRRIEDQLQVAHAVQSRLLPARPPDVAGYDLAGISIPTFEIGGDYFDYFRLGHDRLGLVVADVAGKGIPAALIMATFRALVRTRAQDEADLSQMVGAVNRLLIESTGLPAFVTTVYGTLDVDTGRFAYANCGHNPPLLVRADGRAEELQLGGPFLGVFEEARYVAGSVTLQAGDLLVLYTDGVVDATSADGDEFGTARLAATVHTARHRPVGEVLDAAVRATRDFSGAEAYQDDFTLVVVRRTA